MGGIPTLARRPANSPSPRQQKRLALSIAKIPSLFIFIRLQTSSVNSYLAVTNDPSTLGSNFDLEILVGRKTSEVVENADESSFGEGQVAADSINRLNHFDRVNREGEPRDPRFSCSLVRQIELGGRGVMRPRLRAQVVLELDHQVRLLPAHQVNIAHWP